MSVGPTPNKRLRSNLVRASAPTSPITTPAIVNTIPCLSTQRRIALRLAPNATRMPISRVLWVTEYAITYETTVVQTVSIMEFQNGIVIHETQYFSEPFDPPTWRAQWVEKGN